MAALIRHIVVIMVRFEASGADGRARDVGRVERRAQARAQACDGRCHCFYEVDARPAVPCGGGGPERKGPISRV